MTAPKKQKYVTSHRLHLTICAGCGVAVFDAAAHDTHHATIATHGTAITALKGAITTLKKLAAPKKAS